MIAVWHWLVENNFLKDVLSWVVVVILSSILAKLRLVPLWKEHMEKQNKIADLLDANTPGGIADLIASQQDNIRGKGK